MLALVGRVVEDKPVMQEEHVMDGWAGWLAGCGARQNGHWPETEIG